MWSLGCIVAELFNLDVFIKASNPREYLNSLIQVLGQPNENMRNEIRNKRFATYLKDNESNTKQTKLSQLVPNAPESALDLMSKLLTWDPKDRLTAK